MTYKRSLLIDDLRNLNTDRTTRTFVDGIKALKEETWDILYLDHDLGSLEAGEDGYGVACFLEKNPQHRPKVVVVVSANPVGVENIERCLRQFYIQQHPRTWVLKE